MAAERAVRVPAISTALDRAIGYVAPTWALRRMEARARMSLASGYTGARPVGATKHWYFGSGSADAVSLTDLPRLREASRDLVRNSAIAAGAIDTTVTNVVGTGLVPRAQIDRKLLGLTEEEAREAQEQLDRIWWAWAGSERCDITRSQDFGGLQDLAFRSQLESGDTIAIFRYQDPARNELLGTRIQLIEADRLSNPQYRPDDERFRAGVEINSDGAPVRYHISEYHPFDIYMRGGQRWVSLPAHSRTGERMVLHLFRRRRIGQSRGVPYLAPVVDKLKQLDTLSRAELDASVVQSLLTVFVKTEDGEGIAGVSTGQLDDQAKEIALKSAAVVDLAPGESIDLVNPMRPNSGFDPFWQACMREIGMALELPYEVLVRHFTASYSASRAALLMAWLFFRGRRDWLAWSFCDPIRSRVITEAVARGLFDAPGFFTSPLVRAAWLGCTWTGPSPGQIDPLKEAQAYKLMKDEGFASGAYATTALTGEDWDMVHEELAREHRLRSDAGLVMVAPARETAAPTALLGAGDQDRDAADAEREE